MRTIEIVMRRAPATQSVYIPADKVKNQCFMQGFRTGLQDSGFDIEKVGGVEVVGTCEACTSLIMADEKYHHCPESDCDICESCGKDLEVEGK